MSVNTCLIYRCLSSASAVIRSWFIYELQKSTTIAFSRNSLYTFYSRNPTCGIPPCLPISYRKYPPMPSEIHNCEPPLPFGNPKSCPWYSMDIFWNRPMQLLSYHINTKEIPGELSHKNLISSHVKITCYLHM